MAIFACGSVLLKSESRMLKFKLVFFCDAGLNAQSGHGRFQLVCFALALKMKIKKNWQVVLDIKLIFDDSLQSARKKTPTSTYSGP